MKKNGLSFIIGLLIGSVLFGGSVAYAAGILAERSVSRIFVDGKEIELEAYMIDGHNYVQLRDVGKAVGFNVYWDGTVQIDSTSPYTGVAPDEVFAPEEKAGATYTAGLIDSANPAVFDTIYTREAYDAFRSSILGAQEALQLGSEYPYRACAMNEATFEAMRDAAAAISSWPNYSIKSKPDGARYFAVRLNGNYQAAADYCTPFIDGLSGKDTETQIREIAFFVCDRLSYDADSTSSPRIALASDQVHLGNCMSYAHSFKFLCDLAGIPCIYAHSDVHQWNRVYVNGTWLNADISATDAGDSVSARDHKVILRSDAELQNSIYRQTQPALTAFAQELLVPGSTK